MKSYINCCVYGNFCYHWYVVNGTRKFERVKFQPVLGHTTKDESKWKTIHGENVKIKKFDTIKDAKEFKEYAGGIMMDVYGDIGFQYQFLSFRYPGEVKLQREAINIFNFDIEVYSKDGFPEDFTDRADHPVTTITIQDMNKNEYYLFGYKEEYKNGDDKDLHYFLFENEEQLLDAFIQFINIKEVDVLTGWNIKNFDVPYIINRVKNVLGEERAKEISPIKVIFSHENRSQFGRAQQTYTIKGIQQIDYMDLMKMRGPNFERYQLDFVADKALGIRKVEIDAMSLAELYDTDYSKYCRYNIRDVELVYLLDKKYNFLDLTFHQAYMAHCNFEDTFGTVKPWDSFLYNFLLHQNIMVPPLKPQRKQTFLGGYVKKPKPGLHRNISMWDILSSYPHQEMIWNLSPDTIIDESVLPPELRDIANKYGTVDACVDVENLDEVKEACNKFGVIFTANGVFYDKNKEGFIPQVVVKLFKERLDYKRSAQKLAGEIKELKDEIERIERRASK